MTTIQVFLVDHKLRNSSITYMKAREIEPNSASATLYINNIPYNFYSNIIIREDYYSEMSIEDVYAVGKEKDYYIFEKYPYVSNPIGCVKAPIKEPPKIARSCDVKIIYAYSQRNHNYLIFNEDVNHLIPFFNYDVYDIPDSSIPRVMIRDTYREQITFINPRSIKKVSMKSYQSMIESLSGHHEGNVFGIAWIPDKLSLLKDKFDEVYDFKQVEFIPI